MGKETWKFKDLDDQLSTYSHQWQADQQKQIMLKMAGNSHRKSSKGKRKNNEQNAHNDNVGRSGSRQNNSGQGGRGRGRGRGRGGGRGHNNDQNDHLKNITC
jgi:hypothetical protein